MNVFDNRKFADHPALKEATRDLDAWAHKYRRREYLLGRSALAEALLGSDPQTRRRELRTIPTPNQLVRDRYLPHAKANKRSWHIDELNLRLHILPALGRLMLDEITSEHIAHVIEKMRQGG